MSQHRDGGRTAADGTVQEVGFDWIALSDQTFVGADGQLVIRRALKATDQVFIVQVMPPSDGRKDRDGLILRDTGPLRDCRVGGVDPVV